MKETDNTPKDAKANKRLKAIQYAEKHPVTEACKKYNIDRTSFYKYRNRYKKEGIVGLSDRSKKNQGNPSKFSRETGKYICDFAIRNPDLSIRKIVNRLQDESMMVSDSTVYRILKKKGLALPEARWTHFREYAGLKKIVANEKQIKHLLKIKIQNDPNFRSDYLRLYTLLSKQKNYKEEMTDEEEHELEILKSKVENSVYLP